MEAEPKPPEEYEPSPNDPSGRVRVFFLLKQFVQSLQRRAGSCGAFRVGLGTLGAGAVGITLTAAALVGLSDPGGGPINSVALGRFKFCKTRPSALSQGEAEDSEERAPRQERVQEWYEQQH